MAIFMKFAARQLGVVKGGVTDSRHKDWILVASIEFGYQRPMDGNVTTGRPVLSEVRVTRHLDNASPLLSQAGIVGDVAKVTVEYVKEGASLETYMKVELTGAIVSRYDHLGFDDGSTVEKLSLSYTKLEYTWMKGGIAESWDATEK